MCKNEFEFDTQFHFPIIKHYIKLLEHCIYRTEFWAWQIYKLSVQFIFIFGKFYPLQSLKPSAFPFIRSHCCSLCIQPELTLSSPCIHLCSPSIHCLQFCTLQQALCYVRLPFTKCLVFVHITFKMLSAIVQRSLTFQSFFHLRSVNII